MDSAKAAVKDFMSKSGQHDTTVHEKVAPAVKHETIERQKHEEYISAIDKEVHQDHYHRTVQPVQDREILPETHTAKLGAVQHREFDHRDHDSTKRNLVQEQAQFKDERRVEGTTTSQSVAPTIGGEHVHHHIHETIQPVVNREVIQPNVVHTTVPIHEVHHNKATHHDTTALPVMTMDEFKTKGGVLSGREERYDEFEGVPKNIGGVGGFGHARDGISSSHVGSEHHHGDLSSTHNSGLTGAGATGAGLTGSNTGRHVGTDGPIGSSTGHHDGHHDSTTHTKPSLMDKLNPKVDANGDGKAGFMK